MSERKFRRWLSDIITTKDWRDDRGNYISPNDLINDETYDYRLFYNKQRKDAYDMLNKDSEAHFSDIGKTVYHPTFSNESYYSGRRSLRNPNGVIGGTWGERNGVNTYRLSNSQIQNNWDIDRTINYMNMAEDNGVRLLMPNGRMPVLDDGTVFGGVLPNVEISPNKTTKYKKK